MAISFKDIAPFLNRTQSKTATILGYVGLGTGVLLLLSALQMYININYLLRNKDPKKNGYDFISVTKIITNDNMGKDNRFTLKDVEDFKQQSFTDDAAPLLANQFSVKMSAGNIIPFSTDMLLESLDEKFIDTVPPDFTWKEGQLEVPVIFSADFLEIYNVFAPSQDLPQISAKTASTVTLVMECNGPGGSQQFRAHIVALSDRISSILVPPSFMTWANSKFSGNTDIRSSRIYLKAKDANDPALMNYLKEKNYRINKDKAKFGGIKNTLQAIVTGLAGFGVLVILLAFMLFSFYLQLMIEKSKANLQLMLTLGYSPGWLTRKVSARWIPVYAIIILSALIGTALLHMGFKQVVTHIDDELPGMISWIIVATAALLLVLSVVTNYRMLHKLLHKL
jgi:hypothetical protein